MSSAQLYVNGQWISGSDKGLRAYHPPTGESSDTYQTARGDQLLAMATAARNASIALRKMSPDQRAKVTASFLDLYAKGIELEQAGLVKICTWETGLAIDQPADKPNEFKRILGQMRLWRDIAQWKKWKNDKDNPDNGLWLRSQGIGPVLVIGPNNFPGAFNGISGGHFCAAVATCCPVIGKGHPSHPGTSLALARIAAKAAELAGFPPGFIQFFNEATPANMKEMLETRNIKGVAFTGSRATGRAIGQICFENEIRYTAEMGSWNAFFVLPGVENGEAVGEAFSNSGMIRAGEMCTKSSSFMTDRIELIAHVGNLYSKKPEQLLLSRRTQEDCHRGVEALRAIGATVLAGGEKPTKPGFWYPATFLQLTMQQVLDNPAIAMQEVFGPVAVGIQVDYNNDAFYKFVGDLPGSLVTSIYRGPGDDALYNNILPYLETGRLVDDDMSTGVAVAEEMQHGGPPPSCDPNGITGVGGRAAAAFTREVCYQRKTMPG